MEIKIFKGFEDLYPERVDETDSWYYAQGSPCSESYEVLDYKNEYPGTRLYLIKYPSGKIMNRLDKKKTCL